MHPQKQLGVAHEGAMHTRGSESNHVKSQAGKENLLKSDATRHSCLVERVSNQEEHLRVKFPSQHVIRCKHYIAGIVIVQ